MPAVPIVEEKFSIIKSDDTTFFSENRGKIIPEISKPKERSSGKQSSDTVQTAATSTSHQDRLTAERGYYITSMSVRSNPDLITPSGTIRGNMYIRKDFDENNKD